MDGAPTPGRQERGPVKAGYATADFIVRPLAEADLPQVMELEHQGYSHPWSESVFRDCFRVNYRLLGLAEGESLAGYAVLALMYDEGHLLNLCIAPRHRRHGLARVLLRHVLKEAVSGGMGKVILEVRAGNLSAQRLYLSEGFTVIGKRPGYYPDPGGREDALVMSLSFSGD